MHLHRLRLGLLLLVPVAVALLAASLVPKGENSPPKVNLPSAVLSVATIPDVAEMGLVAPGVGWAVNGIHLYFTTDDGRHWSVLEQPLLPGNVLTHFGGFASIGRNNEWFGAISKGYGTCGHPTAPGPSAGAFSVANVEYTTNGGRTWGTAVLPGCSVLRGLDFLDANHGWAFGSSGSGGTIFATSNGGKSWRTVGSLPVQATLEFSSPADGWATATTSDRVFRTTDGGRSWTSVRLPMPHTLANYSVSYAQPKFFGRESGVIPATVSGSAGVKAVIFSTANGGRKWAASVTPGASQIRAAVANLGALPPVDPIAIVSANDWIVDVAPKLYESVDGGRHWSSTEPRQPWSVSEITTIAFATPSSGWALQRSSALWGSGSLSFLKTSNAGRTWSAIANI